MVVLKVILFKNNHYCHCTKLEPKWRRKNIFDEFVRCNFGFQKISFEGWEGFHVPNTTKISYLKSAFGIKLSLISTLVVNPQSLGNALANFNVESQKWFCRWNKLLKIRTSILLVPSLSSSLISLKTKQLFKQGYLDDNSFQILSCFILLTDK